MSNNSRYRRGVRQLQVLNNTIDTEIAHGKEAIGQEVSCKQGCHGCCYQLVASSLVECLPIVTHMLTSPLRSRYQRMIPTMQLHTRMLQSEGMNSEKWFLMKNPCPLLNKGECTVYEHRPSACRTMISVDDPAMCHPDNGLNSVQQMDTRKLHKLAVLQHRKIAKELHLSHEFMAPLPVALLWTISLLTKGPDEFRRELTKTEFANRNSNIKHWAKIQMPEVEERYASVQSSPTPN